MSYDRVEGEYTTLGEAFHKDIGTYDGSLGRLARYEAILDRSLIRLLSEFRKIQADRRRREKQHAEDWARAGLPPLDPHADYDEHDRGGLLPEPLETSGPPVKIEAIDAEENTEENTEENPEEIPEESYAETHQSPAASHRTPRNRRKRRANHAGNGMNGTKAGGRGRAQHAVPRQPPSV